MKITAQGLFVGVSGAFLGIILFFLMLGLMTGCKTDQKPAVNISPVNDTQVKTPINNTKGTINISSSTLTGSTNVTKIGENAIIKVINEAVTPAVRQTTIKTEITQKTTSGALVTTITTKTVIKPARKPFKYVLLGLFVVFAYIYVKKKTNWLKKGV